MSSLGTHFGRKSSPGLLSSGSTRDRVGVFLDGRGHDLLDVGIAQGKDVRDARRAETLFDRLMQRCLK